MRKNKALKVACVYIGTVIGAGFASGQEIVQFFTVYGIKGVYGIGMASLLFSLMGAFILLKVHQHRISSYHQWIDSIFNNMYMSSVIKGMLSLLLLSIYCVMLAGSGALFEEYFGYTKTLGIVLMSMVACGTFLFSMRGLTYVNTVVVPLLLVGIILMGSFVFLESEGIWSYEIETNVRSFTGNWFTSSLLYVSFNMIGIVMIMSALYPLLENKGVAIIGGLIGGLGLGIMGLFLLLPTLIRYTDVYGTEIPMMCIASKFGHHVGLLYGILLWLAMLTTAIANGFVFIQGIERVWKVNHFVVCLLFCTITMPLAQFGFKNLVRILYPIFGYLGVFIILLIKCKNFYKNE
ncbi:hypothetical protein QBE52_19120 [Clostridiaceae bacterium 35-E11]